MTHDNLKQILSFGMKEGITAFFLSETRFLDKECHQSAAMYQSIATTNGYTFIMKEETISGAIKQNKKTPGGKPMTRSSSALILNAAYLSKIRDIQHGEYGEYTSVIADIANNQKMSTIRLTAVYGDQDMETPWAKNIAQFVREHKDDYHFVGGDFNQRDLNLQETSPMTKALEGYTDVQRMFFETPIPTYGNNVLDYFLISDKVRADIPIDDIVIWDKEQAKIDIGIKLDHKC